MHLALQHLDLLRQSGCGQVQALGRLGVAERLCDRDEVQDAAQVEDDVGEGGINGGLTSWPPRTARLPPGGRRPRTTGPAAPRAVRTHPTLSSPPKSNDVRCQWQGQDQTMPQRSSRVARSRGRPKRRGDGPPHRAPRPQAAVADYEGALHTCELTCRRPRGTAGPPSGWTCSGRPQYRSVVTVATSP